MQVDEISILKTGDLARTQLPEPYFYLDEQQRDIVESWNVGNLVDHLPCWGMYRLHQPYT